MLRNSVDLDELKNRQTYPKNNFFCYKWRIKDHFNRSIDRQMFHLKSLGASNDISLMNDRIMQLYKSSFGSSRKDLIVDLAQEAMGFLDKRRSQQKRVQAKEMVLSQATIELVQYAANVLLGFCTELNSLMGLSELFITAAEPEARKLGMGTEGGITHVVQAGFSTASFRLVVEGRLECINFYLVPADTLLTLNEIALNYEPLEKWRSHVAPTGDVYWTTSEEPIAEDMVEVICAELMRALISATQERLMPMEVIEQDDEALFELCAPAPWEADVARRVSDSCQNVAQGVQYTAQSQPAQTFVQNDIGTASATYPSLAAMTAAQSQGIANAQPKPVAPAAPAAPAPFSNPSMVEELGLMTLTDLPAVGRAHSVPAEKAAAAPAVTACGTYKNVETQYGETNWNTWGDDNDLLEAPTAGERLNMIVEANNYRLPAAPKAPAKGKAARKSAKSEKSEKSAKASSSNASSKPAKSAAPKQPAKANKRVRKGR